MEYGYDAANRVTEATGALNKVWLGYNRANQLTHVIHGDAGRAVFEADPAGRRSQYDYEWDTGRLREIDHRWNTSQTRQLKHNYSYDVDGLRDELIITKSVLGSDVILQVTYEYDNLNRLTAERGYNTQMAPATSVYERLFHYDDAGNADRNVFWYRGASWTGWTQVYNDLNQLTQRYANLDGFDEGNEGDTRWSYTYDTNGNLTQAKEETLGGSWSQSLRWDYTWNVKNEMNHEKKEILARETG